MSAIIENEDRTTLTENVRTTLTKKKHKEEKSERKETGRGREQNNRQKEENMRQTFLIQ